MREELQQLEIYPDHIGLAYEVWAPTGRGGKVPDDCRTRWLRQLAEISISPDYGHFFSRWSKSLTSEPGCQCEVVSLESRLLIGHGNASATDVGLTVHRTWGTPVIPGSALKGVVRHYVLARGDEDSQMIFGTQDVAGKVVFHDAMYVPGSAAEDRPYALDVLTVHHGNYYQDAERSWPNDYEDPNPVHFLTVRPTTQFLVALTGSPEVTGAARDLLLEAVREWGVGAKTSAGYGRLAPTAQGEHVSSSSRHGTAPRHKPGERVTVTRVEDPRKKGRVWLQADDGMGGPCPTGCPPLEMGETIEVEISNINKPPGYNFRMPRRN